MLVLTRLEGESIMVGEDVEVFVMSIRGPKVRLGVRAPLSVAVHRREVFDAVKAEGRVHRRAAAAVEEKRGEFAGVADDEPRPNLAEDAGGG